MKINKITSASNEKIKYIKKLLNNKNRDKDGRFFVENLRIIYDAMKAGFKLHSLFLTKKMVVNADFRMKYVLDNIDEYFLIDEVMNKSFSCLNTPSGICAVFNKQEKEVNFSGTVIYLNKINDPGNMGAIMRSALAFGIKNIVIDEGCVDVYNFKTISAGRDAIFKLNISYDNEMKVFDELKKNMKIYATNLEKGRGIKEILKGANYCVVLGNEANGVDEYILQKSDGFIKIKMAGEMESLNVAVSAGIIFYEIFNL